MGDSSDESDMGVMMLAPFDVDWRSRVHGF
jgi:hypothetical protein